MPSPSHTHATPTRPQTSVQAPMLQVKTHVKGGDMVHNHNEVLVRTPRPTAGLKVKTHVKAGGTKPQHNETLVRAPRLAAELRGKTYVQAGGVIIDYEHSLGSF